MNIEKSSKKEEIQFGKVLNIAGAFIALLIGSGFATGQEVMQYFASYGIYGFLGVLAIFLLLTYVGRSFIMVGHKEQFEKGNDIFSYYCGPYLGKFYDYFSIFFLFLSVIVMVAGASAIGVQHYNWSNYLGGSLLGILAIITVIFGLNKIVEVIGKIGPIIVVLSILVSVITIAQNWNQVDIADITMKANDLVDAKKIHRASANWFLAAGSYVGFCMLWLAAFLSQVGKTSRSRREARIGAEAGAGGFSLAVLLMSAALMFKLDDIAGSQIPSLLLAEDLHHILANIFSIIIFLGIYTTSVPLLWTVSSRFSEEKTTKFKVITIVLGTIAIIIGLKLEFDQLINYVYVINGYIGILLLLIMIFKDIMKITKKN
ncbi:MAG: hypothetical protein Q4P31_03410 [Andreesenia angusta]|nr:hypothetical protein [Andreesenia angusta]